MHAATSRISCLGQTRPTKTFVLGFANSEVESGILEGEPFFEFAKGLEVD